MPQTSCSFHCWLPAPRWRLHRWLAKPDNPGTSPTSPQIQRQAPMTLVKQLKVEEGRREGKTTKSPTQNAPSSRHNDTIKLCNPKYKESHPCSSITKLLTTIIINWPQSLLVVSFNLFKFVVAKNWELTLQWTAWTFCSHSDWSNWNFL